MWSRREEQRTVFVTVGTTSFDALIEAADSDAAHAALGALGYTHIQFQVGRGAARPREASPDASAPASAAAAPRAAPAPGRLPTSFFEFAPSLDAHVAAAALVDVLQLGGGGARLPHALLAQLLLKVQRHLVQPLRARLALALLRLVPLGKRGLLQLGKLALRARGYAFASLQDFDAAAVDLEDAARKRPSLRANYLHVPYERLTIEAVDAGYRAGSRQLRLGRGEAESESGAAGGEDEGEEQWGGEA